MTRLLLLLILSTIGRIASAQSITDISYLLKNRSYEKAKSSTMSMLQKDSSDARLYELLGVTNMSLGYYDTAVTCFDHALRIDKDSGYVSAWSYAYKGYSLLAAGKKDAAIPMLRKTVEMGLTDNSIRFASRILDSIDAEVPMRKYEDNYIPQWVTMEHSNIRYHFQDTNLLTAFASRFMRLHDIAYDSLNTIFQATMTQKINMYVWRDPAIARKITHRPLGFANGAGCFAHVSLQQTLGHELTHIFAWWAWGSKPTVYNRFISEGVAVCFDLSSRDHYTNARQAIIRYKVKSIEHIWSHSRKAKSSILYPLGGAFVKYLYEHVTQEQFRAIIKRQSPEEAKKILGTSDYERIMKDFSMLIGL